jgi:SAM-dependent methyltransferase
VIRPSLQEETDKLARSWMQHDAGMLRDYLVGGVEDPRLNVQSVLSRHFLTRALMGERFNALMDQEIRFAAAMNCLAALAGKMHDTEDLELILYALKRGADNAEGIEIPEFLVRTFAALPMAGDITIPNYIEAFLSGTQFVSGQAQLHQPSLDTFRRLWNQALAPEGSASQLSALNSQPLSVLEPACGSANDYRFLHAYGLARLVRYTGFDLCAKNIENARALFPDVSFAVGNVFEIPAPDRAFDLCLVHDLFEHLSLEGLQTAVAEVCRVTRQGICVGFFNMDEIRDHEVRPVDDYYWNRLSMGRVRELFAEGGFQARVVHIGTFLRRQIGCEETHNPNAYTFLLHRASQSGEGRLAEASAPIPSHTSHPSIAFAASSTPRLTLSPEDPKLPEPTH